MSSDDIPAVEIYRGVPIHDRQSAERIANVVKPGIDFVFAKNNIDELAEYCADHNHSPEARLLAAAMVQALFDQSVNERRSRPNVDIERVNACVAGLNSIRWRSPRYYGSLLEPPPEPHEAHRVRPTEFRW